jgi:hypothetical protein
VPIEHIMAQHTDDELWEAAKWLATLGSRLLVNAGRIAEAARLREEGSYEQVHETQHDRGKTREHR